MKMNTSVQTVERSGIQRESTFAIRASAKAFEILSSGLYKDPILAVIRELSCNAYDAHVVSGKRDVPFEIHLPNALEPYFSVKDDGIGLSDKDIQGVVNADGIREGGLYTTYFDSTKTDSNDEIGAFGLGSKSPYSYSEMFTVISRHGGWKRTYTMYLNEERLPGVALMAEEKTAEQPGLEVRFDVKERDYWAFRDKAASVLRFFKTKPTVKGVSNFRFEELPKGQFSGDGWMVYGKDQYTNGMFTAVMGQVPYRVDIDKLVDYLPTSVLKFIRTINIVTFFEIGDLEIPPDREEVRYDERTIRALVARVTDIRRLFIEELEKRVNNLPDQNFWTKYQSISRISVELFNDPTAIVTFIQGESTNVDLLRYCEAIKARGLLVPGPLSGHVVTVLNNATGRRAAISFKRDKSTDELTVDEDSDEEGAVKPVTIYITPQSSTLVIYSDVSTAVMKRIRLYTQDLRNQCKMPERVVLIHRMTVRNANSAGKVHPGAAAQDAEFAAISDALGNPPIVKLSQIKNVGSSYTKRPLPVYQYAGHKYRRYAGYIAKWSAGFLTDELKDNGGLYFLLDKGKKILDHNGNQVGWANSYEENMGAVVNLINDALGTKYDMKSVLGVTTLTHRRIKSNAKWKNVFEVASGLVQRYEDKTALYRGYTDSEDVFGFKYMMQHLSNSQRQKVINAVDALNDTSEFKIRVKPLLDAFQLVHSSDYNIIKCVDLFEQKILHKTCKTTVAAPNGTMEKLCKKYPMLTFANRLGYDSLDKFLDYVSLIDRS